MLTTNLYESFEEARKLYTNPFKLKSVITADEIWGEIVTNLPELNYHIDERIFDAIHEVRQKYSNKIGIAVKGDRGTGKSHVIHRIWKKIAQDGEAVFAYIGPYTNPKLINSHVRFYLADSFNRRDIQGITQWQRLAAAAIKTLKGTEFEDKYLPYIEKCDSPNELRKYIIDNTNKDTLIKLFDALAEAILEHQSEIDFYFLKALLFLLLKSVKIAQISFSWIKGEDNPEFKKIELPEFSSEEKEDKSIWMIRQISKLAEIASLPVLICFEQIDSAGTDTDSGDSPAESLAKCIDQIYFQCTNVILVCCILSDTWLQIEQMGSGIPDRVGEIAVNTKPPTAEQMIKLVKLRLDWFYKQNNLNSCDFPELFPFEETKIRKIASESAGVRSLMQWCADEFDRITIPLDINDSTPDKKRDFLDKYNELLTRINIPIKDDSKLAAIITRAMEMIPDGGTENVVIEKIIRFSDASHDLHLIVSGYDSLYKRNVKIGVRVSETTNGHTFNAVMKKLLDYEKYRITRGCLIRSTPIPLSWKVGKKFEQELVNEKGGKVVVFKKEEIRPLVAIEEIYEQSENYGFSKEEIIQFVKELRLSGDNLLVCKILSAPV